MPPKRKEFLKPGSKAKAKALAPQSENDFLDAADEFEQSAGKWRAGDAAKATRFFNRAIDMYNTGLQKYPSSFDLAYNKANLEFNMIEDDRIVSMLGNKFDLLQETLKSHRAAVALNPDNTDVLFNTGQVLASLAELLLENGTHDTKFSARELLEEAVDIFTKCLASQQQEYEQMQVELAKANAPQGSSEPVEAEPAMNSETAEQAPMDTSSASSDAPDEWATVVEPVTPESLLETCTAQLGALGTLLSLYDPSDLPAIEAKAQNGLDTVNNKIPVLIKRMQDSPFSTPEEPAPGPVLSIASRDTEEEETSPKDDALLAAAVFQASIAEATYRSNQTTAAQYAAQIEQIFAPLMANFSESKTGPGYTDTLSAHADALIAIASAISDKQQYNTSPSSAEDLEFQWTALTQAQTILTQISGAPHNNTLAPLRLANIFLARGDTDLFRFRISLTETAKPAWVKSKPVLVSNAGVFYRGARSYAEKAGAVDVQKTADAKAIVAEILKAAASGADVQNERWKGRGEDVVRVLEQMVEENILDRENAEGVLTYV